ncbi:MAG TPA: sensor domain-containing diguanylate cyclase [Acidimicrobiia bacterium]|nr:sensor domain-containing diguanylate cyclase [Acidimicrobiia bacterium]
MRTSRAAARPDTRLAWAVLPAVYASTPLAVVGAWFLQRAHLLGDISLVWFVPLVAATAVLNAASQVYWHRRRGGVFAMHVRIAVVMVTTTAVVYAAGWGPVLAIGYALGATDVLRTMGSRSWRPAIAWMVGCVALGQLAVASGTVATIVPGRYAHAVAAVGVVCFTLVIRVLGHTEAIAEEAQGELRDHGEQFQALVQHAMDIIGVLGECGTIRYVSPAIGPMLGYEPHAVEGESFLSLVQPDDAASARGFLHEAVAAPDTARTRELALRHRDGSTRLAAVTLTRRSDARDDDVIVNVHDITTQRALEERLRHDALHDPVTGLANRTAFLEAVRRACARATRERSTLAVLYVDLDGFKRVNDSFGHEAGDRVLVATAQQLAGCVRDGDVVARLGGDEFCVLLERVATLDETIDVADRVIETLAAARLGGAEAVTASIGIALNPAGDLSVSELLRRADQAMYDAKRAGRGRWAASAHVLRRAV